MRYILLIFGNDEDWAQRSSEEIEPILRAHESFTNDLREAGAYVASEALQPSVAATTVRMKDGAPLLTDGPYIETKEQIAGFYLIDAENLDCALIWAKRLAELDGDPVEVRPVITL